jgi:hypothetical protein
MIESQILQTMQSATIAAVAMSITPDMPIKFVAVGLTPPNDQKYIEIVYIPNNDIGRIGAMKRIIAACFG